MAVNIQKYRTPSSAIYRDLKNWLAANDSRITVADETHLNITLGGQTISVRNGTRNATQFFIIVNGTEYTADAVDMTATTGGTFWLYADDNYIIFKYSSNATSAACILAFILTDDNTVLTGIQSGYLATLGLSDIPLYRLSDGQSGFVFPKMINFEMPAGQIYYSPIVTITLGGVIAFYFSDFISISKIAIDSNISMPNGNNYYTIDAFLMVKIN